LPNIAYHLLPSNARQVIVVTAGETGYGLFSVPFESAKTAAAYADMANSKLGISHSEREALLVRSMDPRSTVMAAQFPNAIALASMFPSKTKPARSAQRADEAAGGAAAGVAPFPALEGRTLSTVLAALRVVQAEPGLLRARHIAPIATNDGTAQPLTSDEIDAFCELWNTETLRVTVVVRGGVPSIYSNTPGLDARVLDFDHFETCGCDPARSERNPDCPDHTDAGIAAFAADLKHVDSGSMPMVW
jgi:hypothetical protein